MIICKPNGPRPSSREEGRLIMLIREQSVLMRTTSAPNKPHLNDIQIHQNLSSLKSHCRAFFLSFFLFDLQHVTWKGISWINRRWQPYAQQLKSLIAHKVSWHPGWQLVYFKHWRFKVCQGGFFFPPPFNVLGECKRRFLRWYCFHGSTSFMEELQPCLTCLISSLNLTSPSCNFRLCCQFKWNVLHETSEPDMEVLMIRLPGRGGEQGVFWGTPALEQSSVPDVLLTNRYSWSMGVIFLSHSDQLLIYF